MQRIASSDGMFHDGNPATGVLGTFLAAIWHNSVQEEIAGFIEAAGLTLDPSDNGQLLKAFTAHQMGAAPLADKGAVNAYAASNTVPLTAATLIHGTRQRVTIGTTNSGPSTYSPDGLTPKPVIGLDLQPLQGAELVATQIAEFEYVVAPTVNGGSGAWLLLHCGAGALQVAPASASAHALQRGQLENGFVSGPGIIPVEKFGVVHDPNGQNIAANTAAYLAAIESASGQHALLHREGLAVVVNPLVISYPMHLLLNGTIKLAPNSNANVITLASSNVTIVGTGTVDGNKANQQGGGGTVVGGICANTDAGTSTATPPANPVQLSKIVIDGITVTNCFNWPISLGYMSHSVVRNTTLCNSGNSPQFIFAAQDCWFLHNEVYSITDGGFVFYQGNGKCGAIGNDVHDCHDGIGVYTDTDTMPPDAFILIASNMVHDNLDSGIGVTTGGNAPTINNRNVLVVGNFLFNNNTGGGNGLGSIGVVGASGVTVASNWIQGDGANCAAGNIPLSIVIDAYSTFVVVDSNTISNVGSVAAHGVAIQNNGAKYVTITNNRIFDTNAAPVTASGLAGVCGTGNVIAGNTQMSALVNTLLNIEYAPDTILAGQINSQGAIQFTSQIQINPYTTTGNGIAIAAALAGASPGLVAVGGDANVSLSLTPKGNGIVYSPAQISGGSLALSGSGQIWYAGSGAPTNTNVPVGSMYSNTSGTAGSAFYVFTGGGGWKAIA